MNLTHLAQNKDEWQTMVNMLQQDTGNFVSS
jgi:hypothetical protein